MTCTSDLCVSTVPLFNHLPIKDQGRINDQVNHETVSKGEIILSPVQESKLLILASGRLKVYQLSASGQEQLLRVVQPGDYEGETFIFGGVNDSLYIEALETSRVCVLRQETFKDLLLEYPDLALRLLEINARKMQEVTQQNQLLATDRVELRLLLYLLELAKLEESNNFEIPMKLKDLAAFLGTRPETISRLLTRLEDQGLLARNMRHIQILDQEALESLIQ